MTREKRIEKLRAYHAALSPQMELVPDRMGWENVLKEKRRDDSDPVDPLCLAHACDGVALDLRCACRQWAEHYNVPSDVIFHMVADRFILDLVGVEPHSADYFADMAEEIIVEAICAAKERAA